MAARKIVHLDRDRSRLSALSVPALATRPSLQTKLNRKSYSGRLLLVLPSLLALLSITCTFGGLLPGASGSGEITGPIIAMLAASALDPQGQPVDPKFTFDPSAPQILVAVQVGVLSMPAPMTVTWYQVTDQGDQRLFSDMLQVGSLDRAYSIGKNPGTLADGDYKIVAQLNGQTQQLTVSVVSPSQSPAATNGISTGSSGQPPVSGGSSSVSYPNYAPTSSPASGSACHLSLAPGGPGAGNVSETAPFVEAEVFFQGCDAADVELDAAVENDPPYKIETAHFDAGGSLGGDYPRAFRIDPCALPHPSDLPNTIVKIYAKVLNGKALGMSAELDMRLGDDTLAPRIEIASNPSSKASVKAGDKLTIGFTASDSQNGGPWQTGLQLVEISDSSGQTLYSKTFGPPPKVCQDKQQQWQDSYTYTVPPNAPGSFPLCITAEDYVPFKTTKCISFSASGGDEGSGGAGQGQHWTGSVHTTSNADYGEPGKCTNEQWVSKFDAFVAQDGTVSGSGTGQLTSPAQCVGPGMGTGYGANPAHNVAFVVTGRFDGKSFQLTFRETSIDGGTPGLINYSLVDTGGDMPPLVFSLISPGSAGGLVTIAYTPSHAPGASVSAQHLIDMKCVDCSPP